MIPASFAGNFVDFSKISKLENVTKFTKTIPKDRTEHYSPNENILPNYFVGEYSNALRASYSDKVLWGKLDLVNTSNKPISKIYFWDSALTGYLTFYFKGDEYKTGSSVPMHKRNVPSLYSSVKLTLNPNEKATLHFKRESHHALSTKIYLANELDYYLYKVEKENSYRYYVGAILGLVFYNMMLVIFLRSKKYLVYCIFTLTFLLTVLNLHGVLDYVDVFTGTTFSHHLIVTTSMSLFWVVTFAFIFLDGNIYLREFVKVKKVLIGLALAPLFFLPTFIYDFYGMYFGFYIDFIILITLIFLIVICIISMKRGAPLAKAYLLSWSFIAIGVALYFGNLYSVLPKNFVTENGILFGNLFEMIVLSLGLAYQAAILDKNAQEALIKAEGKEKYQNLLRMISHDISNSMQVLILGTKRLKKISDNNRVLDIAGKIDLSTRNVVEILEQIKTQEKLLQDRESAVLSKVNLATILNELIIIFEDVLIEKNLIIKVDIPHANQIVMGERVSFKNNILGNIISNSIKFSPPGSEINVSCKSKKDRLILIIRDSGSGFSKEALKFINEDSDFNFSTVGTLGEKGTGFGLRIIKSYVKMYQGDLRAYNDQGAVFELSFLTSKA